MQINELLENLAKLAEWSEEKENESVPSYMFDTLTNAIDVINDLQIRNKTLIEDVADVCSQHIDYVANTYDYNYNF